MRIKLLRMLFIFICAGICMPWFTYNPDIMGYCRGLDFLKWICIPLLNITIFLFINPYARFLSATGLVSAAVLLGITVTAFPTWQTVRNINDGFHWKDGFYTVQTFYWMTLVLEIIFFVIYVIDFRKRKKFKEKP